MTTNISMDYIRLDRTSDEELTNRKIGRSETLSKTETMMTQTKPKRCRCEIDSHRRFPKRRSLTPSACDNDQMIAPNQLMAPNNYSSMSQNLKSPHSQSRPQRKRQSRRVSLSSNLPDLLADVFEDCSTIMHCATNALEATSASAAVRLRMKEMKDDSNNFVSGISETNYTAAVEEDTYGISEFERVAEGEPQSDQLHLLEAAILEYDDRLNKEVDELFGCLGEDEA